tara:strand:- start:317 stop:553 length:237 start_codon:yes stop_codon:yes gene_type:complete
MHVIIDGIEYVPKAEMVKPADSKLHQALLSLTEIQYFYECKHKHRAWAWDALNALAPNIARIASGNAQEAFDLIREES